MQFAMRKNKIEIRQRPSRCTSMLWVGLLVGLVSGGQAYGADGDFVWATSIGGTLRDEGLAIALDASGNVYTTGSFSGTVDFDPSSGVFNLTSAGSNATYLSKQDSNGNFVWARAIGATSSGEFERKIVVDASGNVYTTGYFNGTADFDPGASTVNLTSLGARDVFVLKLDSNGNFIWARAMGGGGNDQGEGIAVDSSGNVYTTGLFRATADFDPSSGVANLVGSGETDIFLSKLDSSGNFAWAYAFGSSRFDHGRDLTVDALGNVYMTGFFQDTIDFDPGAGVANLSPASGSTHVFILKLDSGGNFVWAKNMGASTFGAGTDGNGISVDAAGNVYTAGPFDSGIMDFDPGPGTFFLTPAGSNDAYVSKLDPSGNFLWAKSVGGTDSDIAWDIAVDSSGNTYTVGWFGGTVDFDPGVGAFNLSSAGNSDIFVWKLDSNGDFVWAKDMGGTSRDSGFGVAADGSGNVYATGFFNGTADFDPGAGTFNLSSAGDFESFVLKLSGGVSDLEALVDIDPDKINKKSNGRWVTVYIELAEEIGVGTIDVNTIAITGLFGTNCDPNYIQGADLSFTPQIGDHDEDGIDDLTVKFDRQTLQDYICNDDVEIRVEGLLTTGEAFSGIDGIRVK